MSNEPMTLIERLRNPAYVAADDPRPLGLDEPRALAAMKEAADMIERLQRRAGAVSEGESFDEIRRLARAGAPLVVLPSSPVFQTAYQVQYDNYRVPVGGEVEIRGTADKPSDTE